MVQENSVQTRGSEAEVCLAVGEAERQTWLSAEVGQGGAWGNGTKATKNKSDSKRSGEQAIDSSDQAAQTHNNQPLLELIHLQITVHMICNS
jgi:hypothetical protein